MEQNPGIHRVAFLGNYQPRQCGLATFTTDVCESVAAAFPTTECFALAMNDRPEGYAYPDRVRFEIAQQDEGAYDRAADLPQHERGGSPLRPARVRHLRWRLRRARRRNAARGEDARRHHAAHDPHRSQPDPTPGHERNRPAFRPSRDHDPERGPTAQGTFTVCPRKRSTSSRTASPTWRSWTRTITRTSSASRARRCSSLSGCSRRARASRT